MFPGLLLWIWKTVPRASVLHSLLISTSKSSSHHPVLNQHFTLVGDENQEEKEGFVLQAALLVIKRLCRLDCSKLCCHIRSREIQAVPT